MKQFLASAFNISMEEANKEGDLCAFVEEGEVEILASTLKFPKNYAVKDIVVTGMQLSFLFTLSFLFHFFPFTVAPVLYDFASSVSFRSR